MSDDPERADPEIFLWDAQDGHGHTMLGVTDAQYLARRHLLEAVNSMPQATGKIQAARLDLLGMSPHYAYGKVLLRAQRDDTGRLVLDDGTTDPS